MDCFHAKQTTFFSEALSDLVSCSLKEQLHGPVLHWRTDLSPVCCGACALQTNGSPSLCTRAITPEGSSAVSLKLNTALAHNPAGTLLSVNQILSWLHKTLPRDVYRSFPITPNWDQPRYSLGGERMDKQGAHWYDGILGSN